MTKKKTIPEVSDNAEVVDLRRAVVALIFDDPLTDAELRGAGEYLLQQNISDGVASQLRTAIAESRTAYGERPNGSMVSIGYQTAAIALAMLWALPKRRRQGRPPIANIDAAVYELGLTNSPTRGAAKIIAEHIGQPFPRVHAHLKYKKRALKGSNRGKPRTGEKRT